MLNKLGSLIFQSERTQHGFNRVYFIYTNVIRQIDLIDWRYRHSHHISINNLYDRAI